MIKSIPQKIYLQVPDDEYFQDFDNFREDRDVTWCSDRIGDKDIEYFLRRITKKQIFDICMKHLDSHLHIQGEKISQEIAKTLGVK